MVPSRLALLSVTCLIAAACGSAASRRTLEFSPERGLYTLPMCASAADAGGRDCEQTLHTHCGIVSILVSGERWRASPPLYNEARTGPPPGWADPFETGRFQRLAPDEATFVSASGKLAHFVRAGSWQPPACD